MPIKDRRFRVRKIKGYPFYRIRVDDETRAVGIWTNRVSNRNKGGAWKEIKQTKAGKYLIVSLWQGKEEKQEFVHRLVCIAFHGEPQWYTTIKGTRKLQEVCHGPSGSFDNHPDNLRWGTRQENTLDMNRDGVMRKGENHGRSKLNDEDVRKIRQMYQAGGVLQRELGEIFKVPQTTISLIVHRKAWKHVT